MCWSASALTASPQNSSLASPHSLPLCSQQERLLVVPGDATADGLRELLDSGHVVVVMKLSRCQQAVKQLLSEHADSVEAHYYENVGTALAFHTTDPADIIRRDMPYFSIAILRRSRRA